jgi:hypothetical protein
MNETPPLAEALLKQDRLTPGTAPDTLIEQMRRQQTLADQRERFWFRMACGFWITAGVCFLTMAILLGVCVQASAAAGPAQERAEVRHEEVGSGPQWYVDPIMTPFFAALTIFPIAFVGGIFSSVWLLLMRRQAGQAAMQLTLAALMQEIGALKAAQASGAKPS